MSDLEKHRLHRYRPTLLAMRFAVALIAAILLIAGAAVFWLVHTSGEEWIRALAEEKLSETLGQPVHIDSLETNLFSRLQLYGVTLDADGPASARPPIVVDVARIHYRLPEVFSKNPSLREVAFLSPRLSLRADSSGLKDFRFLTARDSTQPPAATGQNRRELEIRRVEVSDGSVIFRDRTIPLNLRLKGLALNLRSSGQGYGMKLAADTLRLVKDNWAIPFTNLSGRGSFEHKRALIDSLRFRLPGLSTAISGTLDFTGPEARTNLATDISGSISPLVQMDNVPDFLLKSSGTIHLHAQITGVLSRPDISGSLIGTDLHLFQNLNFTYAMIVGGYRSGSMVLDSLAIETLGGVMHGAGSLAMTSPFNHTLRLTIKDVDAEKLWLAFYNEESPYDGILNGKLATRGPLLDPVRATLALHIRGSNSRFRGKDLPPLLVDGTMIGGRASFRMTQGGAVVDGDGWLRGHRIGGSFRAMLPSIAPFTSLANLQELEGALELGGTISGSLEQPKVKAHVRASSLSYRNLPVDTLAGSFRWQNSTFTVDQLTARHLQAEIDTVNAPFGLTGLRGNLWWSLNVSGTLDQPTGRFEARLQKPSWRGYRVDSVQMLILLDTESQPSITLLAKRGDMGFALDGKGDWENRSVNALATFFTAPKMIENGRVAGLHRVLPSILTHDPNALGQLRLSAAQDRQGDFSVKVKGSDINLTLLAQVRPHLQSIAGVMNLDAAVQHAGGKSESFLRATVLNPEFSGVRMDSLRLHAVVKAGVLRLDTLNLFRDDSQFSANGTLALPEGKTKSMDGRSIHLQSYARNLDLRLVTPFLPTENVLRGKAAWQLAIHGTLDQPKLRGSLRVQDGYVRLRSTSNPLSHLNLTLRFADEAYTLESLEGVSYNLPFHLQGKGTFNGTSSLTSDFLLALNGEDVLKGKGSLSRHSISMVLDATSLDLKIAQPLITAVDKLEGIVSTSISVEGPLENPAVRGQLSARNLEFARDVIGISLSDGGADMRFEGHHLVVDSLNGKLNNGTLFVRGEASLADRELRDMSFDILMNNVSYVRPKVITVMVDSAQLTYQRLREDVYRLSGELKFGDTRITADLPVRRLLDLASQADRPKPEQPLLFRNTQLDVRVTNDDQFWVTNNLARIRNRVDLDLSGPLTQPSIAGRISVQEGYLIYLDRKFEISTGILDFTDPRQINPIVSLSATSQLKSYQTRDKQAYTILFTAQGPLDQAQIDLQSTPPLDRSDILALLTLGSTRQQLTGNLTLSENNALINAIQQRAENLSSQRISGYVSNRVGSIFGLEEMSIEGNLFNFGTNWGPQLLASKQLGNRVRVTYSTRVGHLNEQGIRLDYQLTDKWSIESQADQQGGTGVDLKYRVRFR